MGTTSNNSWPYPESSDFVADGATAIENLADAIDADFDTGVLKVDSANNRVGINTATPEADLDISGNSPSLLFTSPSDTNRYRIDANMTDAADYGLSFGHWDGAAYQRTVTIVDSGQVGINDTTPSYTLDVNGTARFTGQVYADSILNVTNDLKVDTDTLFVDVSTDRVGINDATPAYSLDVTGDINATADIRIAGNAIGHWTSFTPTLTASVTNPTLGTGSTRAGSYCRVNDIVFYIAYIRFGTSGVNPGSGFYAVSLPVSASTSNSADRMMGTGYAYDNSASVNYSLSVTRVGGSATTVYLGPHGSALVSNASPFTFAANDIIAINLAYRA